LILFAVLAPPLAWAEQLLRPTATPLILRDYILQAVTFVCLTPALILAISLVPPLLLLAGYAAYMWFARGVRGFGDPRLALAKRVTLLAVKWIAVAGFTSPWFWLGAWHTNVVAVFGLAIFVLYLVLIAARVSWRRWLGLVPGLVGIFLAVFFTATEMNDARAAEADRMLDRAAYDAGVLPDLSLVALSVDDRRALIQPPGGKWTPIARTYAPQRFAFDAERGVMYFANYGNRWKRAVTEVHGMEAFEIALPRCSKAIDVVFDRVPPPWTRIYVACEFSGTVHFYNVAEKRNEMMWEVPRAPYALALDNERRLLYVTSEFFVGAVTKLDVLHEHVIGSRTLGMALWGVAVDEQTGNVFVARPLSGDVVVLDRDLRVLARVPTGGAPRDMAMDSFRRVVWVGHYFSGVVTGIGLDNRRVVSAYRARQSGRQHRLRGVALMPNGKLLTADVSGVWMFYPDKW